MTGVRGAVTVVSSTPNTCTVCHGQQVVVWRWACDPQLVHRAPCPHCAVGLPAVYLRRWRTDTPRTGGAA